MYCKPISHQQICFLVWGENSPFQEGYLLLSMSCFFTTKCSNARRLCGAQLLARSGTPYFWMKYWSCVFFERPIAGNLYLVSCVVTIWSYFQVETSINANSQWKSSLSTWNAGFVTHWRHCLCHCSFASITLIFPYLKTDNCLPATWKCSKFDLGSIKLSTDGNGTNWAAELCLRRWNRGWAGCGTGPFGFEEVHGWVWRMWPTELLSQSGLCQHTL